MNKSSMHSVIGTGVKLVELQKNQVVPNAGAVGVSRWMEPNPAYSIIEHLTEAR